MAQLLGPCLGAICYDCYRQLSGVREVRARGVSQDTSGRAVVRHMKCDTSPPETRQPHKDKKRGRSSPTTRKVMALWLSEVLWRSKSLQQVRAHQKISCLVVDIAGTASQPFCLQYLKSQCTQSRRHNQQRGLDARRVSGGEVSHFMCRTTIATGVLPHNGKRNNHLLVIRWPPKVGVAGSSPAGRAIYSINSVSCTLPYSAGSIRDTDCVRFA